MNYDCTEELKDNRLSDVRRQEKSDWWWYGFFSGTAVIGAIAIVVAIMH